MKTTIIDATHVSPRVEMNPEGEIILSGRCIMEDTFKFFAPIMEWVQNLSCSEISMEVRLEYMNTSSSKQLLNLIKTIVSNPAIRTTYIKWFYEEDDEDMLDIGKDFESLIHIPFDFYELNGEAA